MAANRAIAVATVGPSAVDWLGPGGRVEAPVQRTMTWSVRLIEAGTRVVAERAAGLDAAIAAGAETLGSAEAGAAGAETAGAEAAAGWIAADVGLD